MSKLNDPKINKHRVIELNKLTNFIVGVYDKGLKLYSYESRAKTFKDLKNLYRFDINIFDGDYLFRINIINFYLGDSITTFNEWNEIRGFMNENGFSREKSMVCEYCDNEFITKYIPTAAVHEPFCIHNLNNFVYYESQYDELDSLKESDYVDTCDSCNEIIQKSNAYYQCSSCTNIFCQECAEESIIHCNVCGEPICDECEEEFENGEHDECEAEDEPEIIEIRSERINTGYDDNGEMVDFKYEWELSNEFVKILDEHEEDTIFRVYIKEYDIEGLEKGRSDPLMWTKSEILKFMEEVDEDYSFF